MKESVFYNAFLSEEGWYSLEYPITWEVEIVCNIPTFFDPQNGHGSLHILSVKLGDTNNVSDGLTQEYPFLSEEQLEDKMQCFLLSHEHKPETDKIVVYQKKDNVLLLPYEYYTSSRFYMLCMIQRKNIFLLNIYNCIKDSARVEADIIGKMINSIQFK